MSQEPESRSNVTPNGSFSSFDNLSAAGIEDRSQAQALLATLQGLRLKEAELDEKIKEKDRDLKVAIDRRERLRAIKVETADLSRRLETSKTFVTMAKEVVSTFPGDTHILRLERRVETRANEARDAGHVLKQRRTGVEAYQAKIKALQAGKERLLADVAALVWDVKVQFMSETEVHDSVAMVNPGQGVEVLSSVCTERERELEILNQQLDERVRRDNDLTARLQQLQDQIAEAIPRVQNEKDCDIEDIQIEWETEKRHLLTIYGKLCVVNREQNYHLQRGTHIKRAAAKPAIDPTETKLSLNATDLARSVNATKEKLKLNLDDVSAAQSVLTQLKKTGEAERREFNAARTDGEERVRVAEDVRRELQTEQMELRKLKGELSQLLSQLRDNQTQMQRSAITEGKNSKSPQRMLEDRPRQ